MPPWPREREKEWNRLVWLRERAGAEPPAVATAASDDRLSGAHVLVSREGVGLRVWRVPDTNLPVRVVSVEDGVETELEDGASVTTGAAARVVVERRDRVLLDLYLFHGLEARNGVYAEEGAAGGDGVGGGTRGPDTELPPVPTLGPPRVWVLDPTERAAMTRFVLEFVTRGETSFSAAIQRAIGPWKASPALGRLGEYLTHDTPAHRVLYLKRLVEFAGNRELREDLGAALTEPRADGHSLEYLPGWLRKAAGLFDPGEA